MYPEDFSHRYNDMGVQSLAPEKWKCSFLHAGIFYYRIWFLISTLIKVYFEVRKHTLPIVTHLKHKKRVVFENLLQ